MNALILHPHPLESLLLNIYQHITRFREERHQKGLE